jgi:hypothetical protein
MKKVFTIFLLFIYSFTSVGATVHQHLCMGKLVETAIRAVASKKDSCLRCGMNLQQEKDHCCKDKPTQIKLKSEHQPLPVPDQIKFIPVPVIDEFLGCSFSELLSIENVGHATSSPPGLAESIPLFISNAVFRI